MIRSRPLAFAALATERVALATSVAIAFPRSPMIVANQAWDLARHSNGRFVLGLGSQVKAHNERRFSVPWIAPAARLGEYVRGAACDLAHLGDRSETGLSKASTTTFTLMTPEFSPGPQGLPMMPVAMAAVGAGDAEDRRARRRQRAAARLRHAEISAGGGAADAGRPSWLRPARVFPGSR